MLDKSYLRNIVALIAAATLSCSNPVRATSQGALYESCDLAMDGADCLSYPYQTCQMQQVEGVAAEQAVCAHKPVFPVLSQEIFPMILLPFLLGIASVAGVGGGMVVVPIAIGFFHFNSKEAIAISSAIVFETAILRYVFFSAWTKHPEAPEKTEIDYNTVRMVYPLFLFGSYMGVILYIVMSELWLTILIIGCLGTLSIQMIFKSRSKFMAESVKIAKEEAEARANSNDDFQPAPSGGNDGDRDTTPNLKVQSADDTHSSADKTGNEQPLLHINLSTQAADDYLDLAKVQEREKTGGSQWRIQLQTLVLTLLSMLVNMLRGSPKNDSIIGLEKCGTSSWLLLVSFVILLLFITWWNVKQVRKEVALKEKHGALCPSDIRIHENNTLVYILAMAFVGSLLGNALGLGGGFIYNPVQMGLGVAPSVAASTSMYMIMFSAAAATSLLLVFGQVNIPYVLFLAVSCGIGVILGMYFIGGLVKRFKRQSIVAICLAVIITISTGLSAVSNIISLKQQRENGLDIFTGGDLC